MSIPDPSYACFDPLLSISNVTLESASVTDYVCFNVSYAVTNITAIADTYVLTAQEIPWRWYCAWILVVTLIFTVRMWLGYINTNITAIADTYVLTAQPIPWRWYCAWILVVTLIATVRMWL